MGNYPGEYKRASDSLVYILPGSSVRVLRLILYVSLGIRFVYNTYFLRMVYGAHVVVSPSCVGSGVDVAKYGGCGSRAFARPGDVSTILFY